MKSDVVRQNGHGGGRQDIAVTKKLTYKNKIMMLELFYCQWDHMAHLGMFFPAPGWM